jgi:RNA polymerase sigma factor (sigma-70 family)
MELTQKTYNRLRKIIIGMIKKLNIKDEEEALSEMNEVIAQAFLDYRAELLPIGEDNFPKYAIICVRRRLLNFARKSSKESRMTTWIDDVAHKLQDTNKDTTLMFRFNNAVASIKSKLSDRQNNVFKLMLDGMNTEEISATMKINKNTILKEKKLITEILKDNL